MTYLMTNPIQDTIDVSREISELGVLVVLAGLMVVMFLAMVVFVFKVMQKTNSTLLESQERTEGQNKQMIEQNKTIQHLLSQLTEPANIEVLLEQTKWNAEKLLKASFDANMLTLLQGASEILAYNHIADKDYTANRIKALVSAAHFNRVKWLNSFRYKGTRLGDFANSDAWISIKMGIIQKFIYSTDKNRDTLMRDLNIAYMDFNIQINL